MTAISDRIASRRRRKALVVMAAGTDTSDRVALALAASLEQMGVDTAYLGYEVEAQTILRELDRLGRRDLGIVIHRV